MNGRDIRICTIFAFAKMEFMEKLHPIMFAGTGSDVGKSIIAAAFCRIFKQDAISPHRSRHKIWRSIHLPLPKGWR